MTIEEIMARMQAVLDGAEGRSLSDDEVETYTGLEKELDSARRTEEIRARQKAYSTPTGGLQINAKTATDGDDTLERAFEHYLRTGVANQDISELRAQAEGSGSAGGYLVPDGFRTKIVERMKSFGGLQAEAEQLDTASGNSLEWPTLDDTSNSAEIVPENAAASSAGADLVFGTKTLGAYKYEATGAGNLPLKVSWELLQDSAFDIQGLISRKLGERIARKLAVDLITGTGVGEPQGILTPATAVEMFVSSAAPTYAELVTFVHRLDPDYRASAKWLMNDATLGALRKMVDGNNRPLWLPQNESGMGGAMPGGTLLGYPVVIDQAMPDMGDDTTPIVFGDLREAYVVRRVKDITLVVLNELYAVNGQVGFMAWARFDGAVQNDWAYIVGEGQVD